MFKLKIKVSYLLLLSFLVLSSGVAVWILNWRAAGTCGKDNFSFINPIFRCGDRPVIDKAEYSIFRNKLDSTLEDAVRDGRIKDAAVFFRDLANGPTFGINDRMKFIPASLLKVPVMFAFLKAAEENPDLLTQRLVYDEGLEVEEFMQTIPPEQTLQAGESYTIDELLHRMIAFSDNRSMFLLSHYIDETFPDHDLIKETYQDLGVIDAQGDIAMEIITVKQYASFFRLLYNASFLSNEFSDKALGYLADSDYKRGLRDGIPESIMIAHKFSFRSMEDELQLHDCGIIYYPQNPYLLCIMTKGSDTEKLEGFIREVSDAVWQEVGRRKL